MPKEPAQFHPAEDLRPIVLKIIQANSFRFGHLDEDMFCLRRRTGGTPSKWIARVSLVQKRFKDLFGPQVHYILEVDRDQFNLLDPMQKEAVIYHELCHTFLNDKGQHKLVDHDIKEFNAVIEKYGAYLTDVGATMRVIKDRLEKEEKTVDARK